MRLISFKTLKLPAMVICMLAAGICYSCSDHQDISGKEEVILDLEEQERVLQETSNEQERILQGTPAVDPARPETALDDRMPFMYAERSKVPESMNFPREAGSGMPLKRPEVLRMTAPKNT